MSSDQRVFLVDGQAVYLEGGGDISEDVLQQALAQLAGRGQEAELQHTQQGTVLGTHTPADYLLQCSRKSKAAFFGD